jgi:predicted ATPase
VHDGTELTADTKDVQLPVDDVLDLLTGLVDKSLVVAEQTADGTRYRLPETIRQYASDKLVQAGEAVVRTRHRDWYLALAEQAAPELTRRDQVAWFGRLAADHDNLRAALKWSRAEPTAAEEELRLAAALGRFWRIRGHIAEARVRLSEALTRANDAPTPARATALIWAGHLETLYGDLARGQVLGEQAVTVARAVGDGRCVATA